jgi:hypothetical protein
MLRRPRRIALGLWLVGVLLLPLWTVGIVQHEEQLHATTNARIGAIALALLPFVLELGLLTAYVIRCVRGHGSLALLVAIIASEFVVGFVLYVAICGMALV